nr:hypothetical protein CDS [Bradyrhizobium sp.]
MCMFVRSSASVYFGAAFGDLPRQLFKRRMNRLLRQRVVSKSQYELSTGTVAEH